MLALCSKCFQVSLFVIDPLEQFATFFSAASMFAIDKENQIMTIYGQLVHWLIPVVRSTLFLFCISILHMQPHSFFFRNWLVSSCFFLYAAYWLGSFLRLFPTCMHYMNHVFCQQLTTSAILNLWNNASCAKPNAINCHHHLVISRINIKKQNDSMGASR